MTFPPRLVGPLYKILFQQTFSSCQQFHHPLASPHTTVHTFARSLKQRHSPSSQVPKEKRHSSELDNSLSLSPPPARNRNTTKSPSPSLPPLSFQAGPPRPPPLRSSAITYGSAAIVDGTTANGTYQGQSQGLVETLYLRPGAQERAPVSRPSR